MKYCPSCQYEYEDHIVVCSDCGEALISAEDFEAVKDKPAEADQTGEFIKLGGFEWQMLTELESMQQGEQVREIMKQFQIPVELREDGDKTLIYVPKVQYQTGLSVIHQVFAMSAKAGGAAETLEQEFDEMDYDLEDDIPSENDGFGAKLIMVLVIIAVAAMIYAFLS